MKISSFKIIFFVCIFMIFACLGTVNAKDFTQADTSKNIQDFIDDTSIQDSIINLQTGNYYSLKELNITRNITIQSKSDNDIVNIKGDDTSTLFNVRSDGVTIKNLNIIDYAVAIDTKASKLTVENNNITGTIGIQIYCVSVNDLKVSNNNIDVSGNGIYTHGNTNITKFTISNNIINSGANGIELTTFLVSSYHLGTLRDIIIENNTITAVNNGVYCHGNSTETNALHVYNTIIRNNIIHGNLNGILFNTYRIDGLNISGNDIKGENCDGISLNAFYNNFMNILILKGILRDIIINYNSINANNYLLYFNLEVTGVVNIDYNWWSHNDPDTSNLNKFNIPSISMNNYYNVALDKNNAANIDDFVLNNVTLNDGSTDGVDKLPDFYVTIDNNGKIENVLAKGGKIEVLSSGEYIIKYNSQESDQNVTLNIMSSSQRSTYLETSSFHCKPGQLIVIYAILKQTNDVVLANEQVIFKINGKTYTGYTDSNGRAIMDYYPTEEGYFNIEIVFEGNNDYSNSTISTTLNVTKDSNFDDSYLYDNARVQKMIDDTPVGGTLYLTGDYKNLHLIINKPITIIGGKITSTLNSPIFTITGSDVTISGFNLSNTHPNGIVFDIRDGASNVNIINNNIHDSRTGITIFNASNVNILNNIITRCFEGIALEGKSDYIRIEGNNITGNGAGKPNTEGRRIDGDGSGIVVNDKIPNLIITRNIITAHTHGIYFDDGIGDAEVSVEDMIYFNSITGSHRDLDASEYIRSKEDKIFTTGPNWYGGVEGINICPRLVKSATYIFLDIRSVDDLGNFELYFYYIDKKTGKKVIVEDLPPIDIPLQIKGKLIVVTANGTTKLDLTDVISENPSDDLILIVDFYWNIIELTLTPDQYRQALEQANANSNGNNNGNNPNGGNNNGNTSNNNPIIDTINNIVNNANSIFNPNTQTNTGSSTVKTPSSGSESEIGSGSGTNTGSGSGIATGSGSGLATNSTNAQNGQGYQGSKVAQAGITDVAAASGESSDAGESSSESDESEDNSDAYELTPNDQTSNTTNNTAIITAIVIIAVILLISVGIIRRKRFV